MKIPSSETKEIRPPFKLVFRSSKKLLLSLRAAYKSKRLQPGSPVSLRLAGKAELEFRQDLMAVGRFLAAIDLLCNELQCKPEIEIVASRAFARLHLADHLGKYGVSVRETPPRQLELPDLFKKDQRTPAEQTNLFASKSYWHVLIPVTEIVIGGRDPRGLSPESIAANAIERVTGMMREALGTITELGVQLTSVLIESVLASIRELIGNAVLHSQSDSFVVCASLGRSLGFTSSLGVGRRTDSPQAHLFQILVMDGGVGVLESVKATLGRHEHEINQPGAEDSALRQTLESHDLEERATEEALVKSLFGGALAIRKGRLSEGLHEVQRSLEMSNGHLQFRSGSTEVEVRPGTLPGRPIVGIQHTMDAWRLRGVMARVMVSSRELLMQELRASGSGRQMLPKAGALPDLKEARLPARVLGSALQLPLQRQTEMDAEVIVHDLKEVRKRDKTTVSLLDFRGTDAVDVEYLDILLQELAKRSGQPKPGTVPLTHWLVLYSVPRGTIHMLKRRTCDALLVSRNAPLLVYDDSSLPHILGVPRLTESALDVEEAMLFVQLVGSVSERILREMGFCDAVISWMGNCGTDKCSPLLSANRDSGETVFHSAAVSRGIDEQRKVSKAGAKMHCIREKDSAFLLGNQETVDTIVDFCSLWSDTTTLLKCAKLLEGRADLASCDVVVAFMNNGDRLAGALLRGLRWPHLIIVDPYVPDLWAEYDIHGRYILVVDALYPGDDESGYILGLLNCLQKSRPEKYCQALLAFADFRNTPGADLGSTPVITLPDTLPIQPRSIDPKKGGWVLRNSHEYRRVQGVETDSGATERAEKILTPFSYSTIEFLTEFWQHVSTFRLLAVSPSGRETRPVVFYENNERLLQNYRLREVVRDFIGNFIRQSLGGRVDVIIHPTHPVGSLMAQMATDFITDAPLILPIFQQKYGGAIKFSDDDYALFSSLIEKRRSSPTEELRCLIIDDSVLSGSSLFTMLGCARRLRLAPTGVLVLLSRLSPAVSRVFGNLPIQFRYLYRLHMTQQGDDAPDRRLISLSTIVEKKTVSTHARMMAARIRTERAFQLAPLVDECTSDRPPVARHYSLEEAVTGALSTPELHHVLSNLLLHPDPAVLNFETRLAILYNFLEHLSREPSFWNFLSALAPDDLHAKDCSQSVGLVRGALHLLAFSSFSHALSVKEKTAACALAIVDTMSNETMALNHASLLADCIVALGGLGCTAVLSHCVQLVELIAPTVLEIVPDQSAVAPAVSEADAARRRRGALHVLAAIAWTSALLNERKGPGAAEAELGRPERFDPATSIPIEAELLKLDVMADALTSSSKLQTAFGIQSWEDIDDFVTELENAFYVDNRNGGGPADDDRQKSISFLRRAPGFTCTLYTILDVTKADTVLVFARNSTDDPYFLRVFESRAGARAEVLDDDHLRGGLLGSMACRRMAHALPFFLSGKEELRQLDAFAIGEPHRLALGVPISMPGEGDTQYYIVLGYCKPSEGPEVRTTLLSAYFYMRRLDRILGSILTDIQARHIDSSAAWNVQIQLVRSSYHDRRTKRNAKFAARRRFLSRAFSRLDNGELLRRSVQHAQPLLRLDVLRVRMHDVSLEIRRLVDEEYGEIELTAGENLSAVWDRFAISDVRSWIEKWPIQIVDRYQNEEDTTYCSVHKGVLEFVAYECLRNALVYGNGPITVHIGFDRMPYSRDLGFDRASVVIRCENAVEEIGRHEKGTGLSACAAAARAVGGSYVHNYDAVAANPSLPFEVVARIPLSLVPNRLRNRLENLK